MRLLIIVLVNSCLNAVVAQSLSDHYKSLKQLFNDHTRFSMAYYDNPVMMVPTLEAEPSHVADSSLFQRRCGFDKSCFMLYDRQQFFIIKLDQLESERVLLGRRGVEILSPPDTLLLINNYFVREMNGRLGRLLERLEIQVHAQSKSEFRDIQSKIKDHLHSLIGEFDQNK